MQSLHTAFKIAASKIFQVVLAFFRNANREDAGMKKIFSTTLLLVLAGCSDTGFEGGSNPKTSASNSKASAEALAVQETKATFSFGPKSTMADFLFIFDNSGSMNQSLNQLRSGFESLGGASWPADSRVAVMTTLPGDPRNLNQIHPDVNAYPNINLDPGFLNLVSEAARKKFINAPGTTVKGKQGFTEEMCADEWFKPKDVSPQGRPCLSVAIQSPFEGVGVEAGLVALSQIVKKRPKLFRSGTNVNVVFVSDTQDPGKSSPSVQALRPTYAELKPLIESNNTVAGIKLHGITPSENCQTGEGKPSAQTGRGLPYQDAIKASGGVWLDYCEGQQIRTNYKPVAEQILAAASPEPVFVLPSAASSVVRVVVAGSAYPAAQVVLLEDKKSVRLNGLKSNQDVSIEIFFTPN